MENAANAEAVNIDALRFGADGLIPAVVTDAGDGAVLMVAYMNRESLERSLRTGLACFWSRSRGKLWTKGETSGNFLHIVSVTADCDRDTLLLSAVPDGPACHLGTRSCFDYPLEGLERDEKAEEFAAGADEEDGKFTVNALMELIEGRKTEKKEGSYTSYLFEKGLDKILKKVGEESTEVIIAAKGGDKGETVYEIADLAYHVMVLMAETGITPEDITSELASRHVVDKKVKQEKMSAKLK